MNEEMACPVCGKQVCRTCILEHLGFAHGLRCFLSFPPECLCGYEAISYYPTSSEHARLMAGHLTNRGKDHLIPYLVEEALRNMPGPT